MRRRFAAGAVALLVTGAVMASSGSLTFISSPEQQGSAAVAAPLSSSAPVVSAGDVAQKVEEQAQPDSDSAPSSDTVPPGAATSAVFRKHWAAATVVDRVVVSSSSSSTTPLGSATVSFDDGSSVSVETDASGSAEVLFAERTVTSATLTVSSARAAESFTWEIDKATTLVPGSGDLVAVPWASSGAGGAGALALVDGDPGAGESGNEWAPNPSDRSPSVGLYWSSAREVSSVQILGPSAVAFDPASSASASLYGTLVFDDGTRIPVSGIEGGDSQPTTIAFAPQLTTSVTLELLPSIEQANPGLREFAVFPRGVTPPRWPTESSGFTVTPASDAGCGIGSPALGSSTEGAVALVCPAPGAAVSGVFPVVVSGVAGQVVEVRAFDAATATIQLIGSGSIGADGRAQLAVDSARLTAGPTAVSVSYRNTPAGALKDPLVVQVFNNDGVVAPSASAAPSDMTLQWSEEFTEALSVTALGSDSVYAATKPAYWGPSEFGSAIFTDPALGADGLATLSDEYLRIRAQPRGDITDPNGWGREYTSGILSSAKVGATGFAAQYGYFEARILAPAGTGTWPAFWMLNLESAANRTPSSSGEVDAVELYGHETGSSCHSVHRWLDGDDDAETKCFFPNGYSDWALSWHTYGAKIEPDGARYYIDGDEVAFIPNVAYSDEPFFFMLNLSLGGGYPIELDQTGGVKDMYVDWVRVYT